MDSMNIILSLDEYKIYATDNYYLCIPNMDTNFYHVFMGFSEKDLTMLSKEELIHEIRKIGDSINAVYKNGVYVLPIIDPSMLIKLTDENDDYGYNKLLKNIIQPITLSVYGKLVSQNKRVSQIIKMIKQNDIDKKLVGWLSMKLGNNFIKEIMFENNEEISVVSTFDDDTAKKAMNNKIMAIDYQLDEIFEQEQEKSISNTLKPAYSPGFSAIRFLLMVLAILLVIVPILGYMIIK